MYLLGYVSMPRGQQTTMKGSSASQRGSMLIECVYYTVSAFTRSWWVFLQFYSLGHERRCACAAHVRRACWRVETYTEHDSAQGGNATESRCHETMHVFEDFSPAAGAAGLGVADGMTAAMRACLAPPPLSSRAVPAESGCCVFTVGKGAARDGLLLPAARPSEAGASECSEAD